MTHYLIKSINAIVSDAEINREDDCYYIVNDEIKHKSKGISINGNTNRDSPKKIEYSNNPLEGLKPFELVDEVEELAFKLFPKNMVFDEYYVSEFDSNEYFRDTFISGCKSIAGYKAKAGFTESQMIGFAEWCEKQYDWNGAGWVWKSSNAEVVRDSKYVLNAYLQTQDSKLIEVIQIEDNTFKIKP